MELEITGAGSSFDVSEGVFGVEFNSSLVHQAVTAYLSSGRQGSVVQKTRSDVRGGGAKPWKQKGTGRARAGTSRSPLWRSGGVTFASKNRSYVQKLNKKMYRGAMRSILSELVGSGRLILVENVNVAEAKTKLFISKLNEFDVNCRESNVLLVTDDRDEVLELSARNLHRVDVVSAAHINPVSLVRADKVLVSPGAIKVLEGMFS